MDMRGVSVIVPAFKRIKQTVQTIELLPATEVEVIVVDSTPDDSLQHALDSRVTYIRPDKPGIAANKNAGAKAATHPILIFCDSDMEVEGDTIVKTVEALKRHPTAAMVGGTVRWRGGQLDGQKDRPRSEDRMKLVEGTTYVEALYSRYVATYKSVFKMVGGYDEEAFNMRGEGSDLSIRYWRAGFPLVFDESIVVHHVHEAPDSAALRVNHPEWGIAKDLLLLAYKYNMVEGEYPNFAATVAKNLPDSYRFLQGIEKYYDMLVSVKEYLDTFRKTDKPVYDFKFLEVFSEEKIFERCTANAKSKIGQIIK